jgi:hypothetical protein
MKQEIGKEYPSGVSRLNFIKDNADQVIEKGYMKRFSDEEIVEQKTLLSEIDIELNDIDEEKKEFNDKLKLRKKPLEINRKTTLKNIKQKSQFVKEPCYKFVDTSARMVCFYNSEGDLVESRPAWADELNQRNLFQEIRETGTN